MKKSLLVLFLVSTVSIHSQTTDSLSWYRNKLSELKSEYEKKEAVYKSELEEHDAITKMRVDKLQTALIASCLSSLFVVGFCFYVLKKKQKK